jgi:hypothetical protein
VASPRRGEVWPVDLNPPRGHEQAGRRPALVVPADAFNRSRAGLVMVVPLTTRARGIPTHVEVRPPEGDRNNLWEASAGGVTRSRMAGCLKPCLPVPSSRHVRNTGALFPPWGFPGPARPQKTEASRTTIIRRAPDSLRFPS